MRVRVLYTADEHSGGHVFEGLDQPLTIGGSASDLPLAGTDFAAIGYLAQSENALFAQPEDGVRVLHCNGQPLAASRWLEDGDSLTAPGGRLEVVMSAEEVVLRLTRSVEASSPASAPRPTLRPPGRPPERAPETAPTRVWIRPVEFTPNPIVAGRRGLPLLAGLGRRLAWLLAAVVMLSTALYLWSTRSVTLEIDPRADKIEIDGPSPAFRLAGRYRLLPGQYALVAEKEGYRRLETSFEVGREPSASFAFRLESLPGRLSIEVSPPSQAEVLIAGELVGTTPFEPLELAPGDYEVSVRASGYLPASETATVGAAGTVTRLAFELELNSAPVSFSSKPTGATVLVDGKPLGKTPIEQPVEAGGRQVEMVLAGFKPHRRMIEVVAGEPLDLAPVVLVPADGNLVVRSVPSAASVTVAGEFKGLTPLDLEVPPGRQVEVRFSKAGHQSHAESVLVEAGRSRELAVELAALLGEVEVRAQPAGAELWVDGEPRGKADQTLELSAEPHRIEVRLAGFEPQVRTLTPTPGVRQAVVVELTTAEEERARATPETVETTEGQTLRLLSGGRYRLGASRREPGRRANEAYRDVELTRPFYMATREVTNREFRRFRSGHLSGKFDAVSLETDHHPVVRVSRQDAARYCNWLSEREGLPAAYVERDGELVGAQPMTLGYRLPTEAEWVRAARYADGGEALKYPWGAALPIPAGAGNFGDQSARSVFAEALPGYDDGFAGTSPVDATAPNALGLHGLGDNVSEWMHDRYATNPGRGALERDPLGPQTGEEHVIRGGSWMDTSATELRLSYRDQGELGRPDVGFRIARYAE